MPSRRALLRTLSIGALAAAGLTDRLDRSDGAPTRSVGDRFATDDGRALHVSHPLVHPSVTTVEALSHHRYERVADAGDDHFLSFLVTTGFEPGPGGRTNSHDLIDPRWRSRWTDHATARSCPFGPTGFGVGRANVL